MSGSRPVFVNTMVYKEALDASTTVQADLVAEVLALGATGIEIRREYLSPEPAARREELLTIAGLATEAGLEVYYSVPESLFVDGEASPLLTGYLDEAATLGALSVKLNIGEPGDELTGLGSLVEALLAASARVTIENDQTARNGRLDVVAALLRDLRAQNVPIGYTFDAGNWLWAGVDPVAAARELGRYATVFHLKDIGRLGGLHSVLLDEGDVDWRSVLREIGTHVPVVLEYPIPDRATAASELAKIRRVLAELTSD
ncbi:sugar phosphate isomerase/epimerase [Cryobacterium sp. 10I1]|uniref:sugar phosphate isomerase/epimerase family protein n=1 Tax=unclassified Cryobacterium TaxID=2649013 RepID=UPI002AC932A4|nr:MULTISPECIES: sugar phosphate isomerase/epimerase [unclassified Cryobacterium]MEB0286885.1 sugar phosphate isomerase/epimerase [Cryobacterium sp. 10S3]MEB0304909.1 sugar phosphate isomerase/epimerase [Cryobacterium sp. 10I1]WPX13433.1 sugar phosphate isomerase/epimerase [Cryobacterium sp. 10S3]